LLISAIVVFVLAGQLKKSYKERAEQVTTHSLPSSPMGTFTVAVPEVAADSRFSVDDLKLRLRQADGDSLTLVQTVEGRGATRKEAFQAASEVQYGFRFEDDTLLALSPQFNLVDNAKYRMQNVKLTLNVPEGQKFRLAPDAAEMARDALQDIDLWNLEDEDHTFLFRRGRLQCLDCPSTNTDEDLVVEREDTAGDETNAVIKLSTKNDSIDGELIDLSINKQGFETVVRDKNTGKKMRIRIEGDSVIKKVENNLRKKSK
jgi:hypothetical protein